MTCDAPQPGGSRCGRPAWRQYRDVNDVTRSFCVHAQCAWRTVEKYPPVADTQRRVTP